jgi:anti-anti-sigma factor
MECTTMLEVAPGWSTDVTRGPDWLFVRLRVSSPDWLDASGLAQSVWAILEQQFARRLVLELDELPHLSSSLLGELVRLSKRVRAKGGLIRLCGLSEENLGMLQLMRLDVCFPHFSSRADAVKGFRPIQPR